MGGETELVEVSRLVLGNRYHVCAAISCHVTSSLYIDYLWSVGLSTHRSLSVSTLIFNSYEL